jgi:hypothetical protein
MVAALNGQASVDPSRLFPSDEKTRFGDWVKAGALKAGDQVSTRGSIPQANAATLLGPCLAANDNGVPASGLPLKAGADNTPLTVTDIIRDSRAARVYNFEVESQGGEVTHNYFVGDDAAWVHNARIPRVSSGKLRKLSEEYWGRTWPRDPDTGANLDACHIKALADGGSNCACKIKPMTRADHIAEHVANGDFVRWALRRWGGTL